MGACDFCGGEGFIRVPQVKRPPNDFRLLGYSEDEERARGWLNFRAGWLAYEASIFSHARLDTLQISVEFYDLLLAWPKDRQILAFPWFALGGQYIVKKCACRSCAEMAIQAADEDDLAFALQYQARLDLRARYFLAGYGIDHDGPRDLRYLMDRLGSRPVPRLANQY